MASRASTRLTLDEVLSGVFGDDFGLSDSESSEEEGEDGYTYSGKLNLACGEVVALSKAVSTVFAVIIMPPQLKRHPAHEHNFSSLNLAPHIFLDYFRRRLTN